MAVVEFQADFHVEIDLASVEPGYVLLHIALVLIAERRVRVCLC